MAEYWEPIHERGQETLAVWEHFDSGFVVGRHTFGQHKADVSLLFTQATVRDTQQDVLDMAVIERDTNLEMLRDWNVRVPQAIEADLEADDVLLVELNAIYAVTGEGQESVLERTRKVIALWKQVNAARAAAAPPLDPLQVGRKTVGDVAAALENHPQLLQTVATEAGELTRKKSQLKATADRVDRNNKRWYKSWSGNFKAGTAENEALRQIKTGSKPRRKRESETPGQPDSSPPG